MTGELPAAPQPRPVVEIRLAVAESEARALQQQKGLLRKGLAGPAIGVIVAALITTGGTLFAEYADQGAPVACADERISAAELFERDGQWTEIPASSPAQEQCNINGYIHDLQSLEGEE